MKLPIVVKKQGLYCPEGDFFIDAKLPVPLSLITHAHSDHVCFGHGLSIAAAPSLELLRHRLGSESKIQTHPYRQKFKLNNCWVSFHSAGHILGSAQIRIETNHEVCVISGDYKRQLDSTVEPFELVKCDIFVTESTFALPIYRFQAGDVIAKSIYEWWQENQERGICSLLYCYAMGKAQRVQSLLAKYTDQPIYVHGAIQGISDIYTKQGIALIPYLPVAENKDKTFAKELILAPPIAKGSLWQKKFYPYKTAFASGWMSVRGMRKQRNVDRGFALSDHADWDELLKTIRETEASTVLTTHGNTHVLAQYLQEQAVHAFSLKGLEEPEEAID